MKVKSRHVRASPKRMMFRPRTECSKRRSTLCLTLMLRAQECLAAWRCSPRYAGPRRGQQLGRCAPYRFLLEIGEHLPLVSTSMKHAGCCGDDCKSEAVRDQVLCGTLKAWQHFPRLQRRSARREGSRWRTRVTHQGGGMISVSDHQLRIVAAAADLLAAEARGTFLRCVVAERVAISATATSNRRCARRCSISQPHDVLEDNAAGGQRARFPVERWRVKTAPRVRCPAPGQRRSLVVSGVSRLCAAAPAAWRCWRRCAGPRRGSAAWPLHRVFRFLLELARLWELLHEASRTKRVGDHRTTRQSGVV